MYVIRYEDTTTTTLKEFSITTELPTPDMSRHKKLPNALIFEEGITVTLIQIYQEMSKSDKNCHFGLAENTMLKHHIQQIK